MGPLRNKAHPQGSQGVVLCPATQGSGGPHWLSLHVKATGFYCWCAAEPLGVCLGSSLLKAFLFPGWPTQHSHGGPQPHRALSAGVDPREHGACQPAHACWPSALQPPSGLSPHNCAQALASPCLHHNTATLF